MNTLQGSFPAGNRLIRLDYQAGLSGLIGSIASAATARFSHMEENASGWAYVETPGQAQTLGPALGRIFPSCSPGRGRSRRRYRGLRYADRLLGYGGGGQGRFIFRSVFIV